MIEFKDPFRGGLSTGLKWFWAFCNTGVAMEISPESLYCQPLSGFYQSYFRAVVLNNTVQINIGIRKMFCKSSASLFRDDFGFIKGN